MSPNDNRKVFHFESFTAFKLNQKFLLYSMGQESATLPLQLPSFTLFFQ